MTATHASGVADFGTLAPTVLLGLAGTGFVAAILADVRLPLVSSDRDAFVALAVLGWIGCSVAAGRDIGALGPTHPTILVAAGLGILALAVIGAVVLGRSDLLAAFGGGSGERGAFVALAVVLGAKVALRLVTWTLPRGS